MIATERLEMEQIAREGCLFLFAGLNDKIDEQASVWADRDPDFWATMGRQDPQVQTEHVPDENFYVGHVPSLIEAPVEKYPNCATYAFSATPRRNDDDEAETYEIRIAVELMCKSFIGEEEVNSRLHRTLEAAHSVMVTPDARWMDGLVSIPINSTPSITVGDVFVRRQEKSRGERFFWQGARLEYALERYMSY